MALLGIMVCSDDHHRVRPIQDESYYRTCCEIAAAQRMTAFVFSPQAIDWEREQAVGYTFSQRLNKWVKKRFRLPQLIYDRCFYKNRKQYTQYVATVSQLRQRHDIRFLGHPLRGKLAIYKTLLRDETLKGHLPHTAPYREQHLIKRLRTDGQAFLKPVSGSHGKGALHIKRLADSYEIKGRTAHNKPFAIALRGDAQLIRWLKRFMRLRNYIMQPYLTLLTKAGEAYDIRSLMQKNDTGRWKHTGMAVRKGMPGSMTSNLHGGGKAEEVLPFLEDAFGMPLGRLMQQHIVELSHAISLCLERYYGRLFELGIDYGIDQQGQIWVLEVNSKPGRAIFTHLQNSELRKASLRNPIHYARYIYDRQLGG